MASLSFDPIAPVYDATRGYPESVVQKITLGIEKVAAATPETTILEVGIGTGRIAYPLASLGHTYTGVDISEKMVELLEAKLRADHWAEQQLPWGTLSDEDAARPSTVHRFVDSAKRATMRLVMSDVTKLPFQNASFDVVIAVHVFHLVDGWEQAIEEILRVLRPGGLFLQGWDEHIVSDVRRVEEEWPKILHALGGKINRPGASRQSVSNMLKSKGLVAQEQILVDWESVVTPRQEVEYVTKRIWSSTLGVPDDIFAVSAQRLWTWAQQFYGVAIDTKHKQGRHFVISKVRV